MPFDLLWVFFLASLLLAVAPGPDNIFVLTQSLVFGSRAGLLVMLGLCSGLLFHTALVAFGLAVLIAASARLLLLVKLIGAGYLIYLARLSWNNAGKQASTKPQIALGPWQLYRRGIMMNVSNPKVAIFFLAFLPQFVDVAYGPVSMQIVQLGIIFMLSTVLVFGGIALLAGRYSEQLNQSPWRRRVLNRAVSVVFVLLALNLCYGIVSNSAPGVLNEGS